jgi:hypothetical protein
VHESGRIPPLQNNNHRARGGQTILRQCLPVVRPTRQGHIRQRPPIHILLRKGTRSTTGDQTKRVLSVPSPNRQTIRTDKSVDRTIPPPDHQQRPNRLERLVGNSHYSAQQPQERHHQHRPVRSTPRLHTSPTPHGPPSITEPTCGGQEANRTREACTSDRSHQSHRPSNATTPVQRGSRSLARGKKPPTALPDP